MLEPPRCTTRRVSGWSQRLVGPQALRGLPAQAHGAAPQEGVGEADVDLDGLRQRGLGRGVAFEPEFGLAFPAQYPGGVGFEIEGALEIHDRGRGRALKHARAAAPGVREGGLGGALDRRGEVGEGGLPLPELAARPPAQDQACSRSAAIAREIFRPREVRRRIRSRRAIGARGRLRGRA